jgi:hypothetical protein
VTDAFDHTEPISMIRVLLIGARWEDGRMTGRKFALIIAKTRASYAALLQDEELAKIRLSPC